VQATVKALKTLVSGCSKYLTGNKGVME